MAGIMFYSAIFVALLSTFVDSASQSNRGRTEPGAVTSKKADNCGSCPGNRQLSPEDMAEIINNAEVLKLLRRSMTGAGRSDADGISENLRETGTRSASKKRRPTVTEKIQGSQQRWEQDRSSIDDINEPRRIRSRQRNVNKNLNVNRIKNREDKNNFDNEPNETDNSEGESGDTNGSMEPSQDDQFDAVVRILERMQSQENRNDNKNVNVAKIRGRKREPRYRMIPNVNSSPGAKYDPPPYVTNRSNALKQQNRNVNTNTNINQNVNDISIGKLRQKNRDKEGEELRDEEHGSGVDEVVADSDGNEKKSTLENDESAITSSTQDSVQIEDTEEAKPSSTSEPLEIVASSTTPAVEVVESASSNDESLDKKPRKHHRTKAHGKGHGKRHRKRHHHKHRDSNQQQQNSQQLVIGTTENLPSTSTMSAVENEPIESSPSSTTTDPLEEDSKSDDNGVLTHSILKLLIVKTGQMGSSKTDRLKRLLDQLNAEEKETILHDLKQKMSEDSMRVKLVGKTRVKHIIVSESMPKIFVGILGKSSKDSQILGDKDAKNPKSLNTISENRHESNIDVENVAENVSDNKETKRSQEVEEHPSSAAPTDDDARENENSSHSEESLREKEVKGIYDEAMEVLQKQEVHSSEDAAGSKDDGEHDTSAESIVIKIPEEKQLRGARPRSDSELESMDKDEETNSNEDSNGKIDEKKLSSPMRGRLVAGKSDSMKGPQNVRSSESEETDQIEEGSKALYEEVKTRGRNRGQHSDTSKNSNVNSNVNSNRIGSDPRELEEPTDRAPELGRPKSRTGRKRERPSLDAEPDSVHRNGNANTNQNVNVNNIGDRSQSPDETGSDAENSRRSATRRSHRNRNRNVNTNVNSNVNRNVNVNNIQDPVEEDFDEIDEMRSSRRTLDRTISNNANSNSNSNVNSNVNVNRNVGHRLPRRRVPRRGQRKDEVKLSQKAMDSILRQVKKKLAEKEEDTSDDSNEDNRRSMQSLHKRHNDDAYLER